MRDTQAEGIGTGGSAGGVCGRRPANGAHASVSVCGRACVQCAGGAKRCGRLSGGSWRGQAQAQACGTSGTGEQLAGSCPLAEGACMSGGNGAQLERTEPNRFSSSVSPLPFLFKQPMFRRFKHKILHRNFQFSKNESCIGLKEEQLCLKAFSKISNILKVISLQSLEKFTF